SLEPTAGQVVAETTLTVRGRVDPPRGHVVVAGRAAALRDDGSFELDVPLTPGDHALEVTARGDGLLSTTRVISVVCDPDPPGLDVSSPEEGLETELPIVSVAAVVSDLTLERVL